MDTHCLREKQSWRETRRGKRALVASVTSEGQTLRTSVDTHQAPHQAPPSVRTREAWYVGSVGMGGKRGGSVDTHFFETILLALSMSSPLEIWKGMSYGVTAQQICQGWRGRGVSLL